MLAAPLRLNPFAYLIISIVFIRIIRDDLRQPKIRILAGVYVCVQLAHFRRFRNSMGRSLNHFTFSLTIYGGARG